MKIATPITATTYSTIALNEITPNQKKKVSISSLSNHQAIITE